jgi:hypothetical protein
MASQCVIIVATQSPAQVMLTHWRPSNHYNHALTRHW